MSEISLRQEKQLSPVRSEVLALISVIRPILLGVLYSTRKEFIDEAGGFENVKLKMLPQLHTKGDGDVGICFEWAIHDAIRQNSPLVLERIEDAIKKCKVRGADITSILFGAEKSGGLNLIDTANNILTDNSRLLAGEQAQPVKLKRHLGKLVGAFKNRRTGPALPYSISGLWKADLFVGSKASDQWVGSTVKINPNDLEAAKGLRVGIVPISQGKSDIVRHDPSKNLIICPIPYDRSFMELFYTGWGVVQSFLLSHGNMPKESMLPLPAQRQAVKELISRREFPVIEVTESLEALSQHNLLASSEIKVPTQIEKPSEAAMSTIITPMPTLSN